MLRSVTFLYLLRSYSCLLVHTVMLLFFACPKKSNQKKRHPDVRRGIVSLASLGEGKLADKQQSAHTSPPLNRSRSWTLHSAPIGEKGIVLSINFFIYYRFIVLLEAEFTCFGATSFTSYVGAVINRPQNITKPK